MMRRRWRIAQQTSGHRLHQLLAARILRRSMESGQTDIIVMKFGGTSVAGAAELKRAAARIVAAREAGSHVVAVLSGEPPLTPVP